ncbi:hypothetical protein Salat_1870700 [Sesamum alatum]|uniref:Uncharacterized protein n=1 Tax=Sesamum alatum TaxID=300844 RepID=A0AAE1Y471_9LAMI|nr:hypothetical protein Salat_1870700 [Sesamum alatum]
MQNFKAEGKLTPGRVEEDLMAFKPKNVLFEEAANLPVTVQTAVEGFSTRKVKLRKGDWSILVYMAYAMGPDGREEFKPERWLENGTFQPESPFKFVAFYVSSSFTVSACSRITCICSTDDDSYNFLLVQTLRM